MDIRIRLVKVGALRLIIHAWAMRTMAGLFYLNALRWGAYGATARQMRLPVRCLLQREILSQTPMALCMRGRFAAPLHALLRASVSRACQGASMGGHSTQ